MTIHPPRQINTGDDIAPLIRAAHLQNTAVTAAQFHEVIGLQDRIVEFQETHRLFTIKPQFNAIHRQHPVDRKMHAVIAQERNIFQLVEPFRVIDHDGIGQPIAKMQVFFKNLTDAIFVFFNLMVRKQGALGVFARRVANFCGAAAHQDNRLVAGLLKNSQHHDLHQ